MVWIEANISGTERYKIPTCWFSIHEKNHAACAGECHFWNADGWWKSCYDKKLNDDKNIKSDRKSN